MLGDGADEQVWMGLSQEVTKDRGKKAGGRRQVGEGRWGERHQRHGKQLV